MMSTDRETQKPLLASRVGVVSRLARSLIGKEFIMNSNMLSDAIKRYIQTSDTDYAVLINGAWGVGKTYYVRTVIKTLVEKTERRHPARTSLQFAYVTLYGVCNCGDVRDRILSAIFPFKDTNSFKIAKALLETALKRDNLDIVIQRLNIDMGDIVLIFDDLERISPSADIVNILGCLNGYVEHKGVKAIIVCNESEIAHPQYHRTKEKIVRFTYLYKPDVSAIIDMIIAQPAQVEPDVHAALCRNRDYLHLVSLGKIVNIRTLKAIRGSLEVAMGYLQRGSYQEDQFNHFVDALLRCLVGLHYEINGGKETREAVKNFCEEPLSLMSLAFRQRNRAANDIPDREQYAERFYREYCPGDSNPFVSKSACDIAFDGIGSAVDLNNECASFIKERYSTDKAMTLLSDYWGMSDTDFDESVREWIRRLHNNNIDNVVLLLRVIDYLCYFVSKGLVASTNCDELMKMGKDNLNYIATHNAADFAAILDSPLGLRSLQLQGDVSKCLLLEAQIMAEALRGILVREEAMAVWARIVRSGNESYLYEIFGMASKWTMAPFFNLLDGNVFVASFDTMQSKLIRIFDSIIGTRYKNRNGALLDAEYEPLESLKSYLEDTLIKASAGEQRTLHMCACEQLRDRISDVLETHQGSSGKAT